MATYNPLMLGDLGDDSPRRAHAPSTEATPAGPAGEVDAAAIAGLIDEAVLLVRQLRSAAGTVPGEVTVSGERRNLLWELERGGPQTVPQLARSRAVTRQHVQVLANSLEEEGHVEFSANPAHRRSRLVRLTTSGAERLAELRRREAELLNGMKTGASTEKVERVHLSIPILYPFRMHTVVFIRVVIQDFNTLHM
jgi:DNA-binding MarR family transcriptional regulator